ncbi:MAG: bifunctional 4-hydroxy-2-oxoglutarate aldolase/2-dehydro-3-deoxy-phosphogluconate aldolase [Longicatena sp.]
MEIIDKLHNFGIVPVIAIDSKEAAALLAIALCKGGLAVAEVTYRTSCAHDALKEMKRVCPQMLLGAGTVLNRGQVDSAIDAGAEFIVSPGLNTDVVEYCIEKNILVIPGCATPSDIERAIELGLKTVKFFPSEANGGLKAIKAMSAPYSDITFMPTGGINEENLNSYLEFDKIIACGGTWMINKAYIENKEYKKIEELVHDSISKMLNIHLAHVGLNTKTKSKKLAKKMSEFSLVNCDERKNSIFVGDLELMINPTRGEYGHLAYSTTNIERAKFFMENAGIIFDKETAMYDEKGKLKFIYTNECINGFAIHLIKE